MDSISDWVYHHKPMIIAFIILMLGGISGVFAMTYDWEKESEETLISDNNIKEEVTEEIEKKEEEQQEVEEKEETFWIVDIKGAVANPNVYEVKEGTRVFEALSLAGGTLDNATTENINLSKKISDEMVIYIYTKEEYQEKTSCSVENDYDSEISKEINEKISVIEKNSVNEKDEKISINKATKEDFMSLEGIGEAKAESIINYRTEHGGFQRIEELKNISGIGEALYEKIKNSLTL